MTQRARTLRTSCLPAKARLARRPARIKDIRDGASRTIAVVEAQRDVPWTKPEDIEIDPDETKPLPKFGFGRTDGLFGFTMADGSVHSGVNSVDPKVLRLLFTIADGQVVPEEFWMQDVLGRPNPAPQPQSSGTQPAAAGGVGTRGLLQGIEARRESGRQVLSLNNAKQLSLALLMYETTHRQLPSAVVMGKDGKTPHSWRVEILPYLEQQALYNQYRLDEPWDSENNRKLLDKMPSVYLDPSDNRNSTNASYFMPTGKGTIGESLGKKFRDLTDGFEQHDSDR